MLLVLVLLTGPVACTYLPPAGPSTTLGYIELMDRAARANDAELTGMQAEAQARFRGNATPDNRLRLALVLSAPAASLDDVRRSIELLDTLAASPGSREPALHQLARARREDAQTRIALHADNANMSDRLAELRRSLNEANEKIEELLNIEQTMENGRRREPGEDFKQ